MDGLPPVENHEADYLVIGAGGRTMAFVDELLNWSDANFIIVDRRDKPGGHWNDAYPFVRLHQPAETYGVTSRRLGELAKDTVGLNKGMYALSSGAEVLGYYDRVMQGRLLSSGRVQYFPRCEVTADNEFRSLLTGQRHRVNVRKYVVDSTYHSPEIPATRPPRYSVTGVPCVPPNKLPEIDDVIENFVVVGGGKTGIDTCQWLLEHDVSPEQIIWLVPRDSWFQNRATLQPGDLHFDFWEGLIKNFEALTAATSIADLFDRLEQNGQLFRLDPRFRPSVYRCATISEAELVELRRITNVVRLGRLKAVEPGSLILDHGKVRLAPKSLVVDCSAAGITTKPQIPIWSGNRMVLQDVRTCNTSFSAAFIGFIEAEFADPAQKNALCTPVPLAALEIDWLRMLAASEKNRVAWSAFPKIQEWTVNTRTALAVFMKAEPETPEKISILKRLEAARVTGMPKVSQLLASVT